MKLRSAARHFPLCSLAGVLLGAWLLLLAIHPCALAQGVRFTHGPLPEGWQEGYFGVAPAEGSPYDTYQIKEFSFGYEPVYSEGIYHNAGGDIGVYEVGYDELLRWLSAEREYVASYWNLPHLQRRYPDLVFTVREDSQSQATVDGYPATLMRRVVDTYNPGENITNNTLVKVYWVDLGGQGVAIDVILNTSSGHDVTLAQMEREADAFIATFRFPRSAPPPTTGPTPPQDGDGDFPWEVVIGGLAALGLAAAARALVTRAKARPKAKPKSEPEKKKKEQETAGYILQLSHDRLEMRTGEAAQLEAAVWRVDSKGQYTLASDAQIRLLPPTGIAALPAQGQGRVTCRIEQRDPQLGGEHILTVQAQAGGEGYASDVTLCLEADYRIEFF